MIFLYLLLALAAGGLMPAQAGINAQLSRYTGHPVLAALISFTVGTVALLAYSLFIRSQWPALKAFAGAPWWVWIGGLLGAFFVAAAAALAPALGAATLVGVTIAGQMIVSIFLDHFGLIGFTQRPMNLWRAVGAVMLLGGVALIRRF